jgi:glycosyl transferase, family 25
MLPRVLLINLDRSTDRRQVSERVLNDLGLSWQRIAGVDGALLSEAQRRQLNPPCGWHEWFRPLTPGEVGCFLGHMRCWQHVVDQELPWALVLEDDFAPEPGVAFAHLEALAQAPGNWDVIRLSNASAPLAGVPGPQWLDVQPGVGRFTNGTAYWVSNAGARKLLRARATLCRPLDFDLRHHWERDLRMAVTAVRLFRQRSHEETASVIGDRTAYRRAPVVQRWGIYGRKHLYHLAFFAADRWHWGRRRVEGDAHFNHPSAQSQAPSRSLRR